MRSDYDIGKYPNYDISKVSNESELYTYLCCSILLYDFDTTDNRLFKYFRDLCETYTCIKYKDKYIWIFFFINDTHIIMEKRDK